MQCACGRSSTTGEAPFANSSVLASCSRVVYNADSVSKRQRIARGGLPSPGPSGYLGSVLGEASLPLCSSLKPSSHRRVIRCRKFGAVIHHRPFPSQPHWPTPPQAAPLRFVSVIGWLVNWPQSTEGCTASRGIFLPRGDLYFHHRFNSVQLQDAVSISTTSFDVIPECNRFSTRAVHKCCHFSSSVAR